MWPTTPDSKSACPTSPLRRAFALSAAAALTLIAVCGPVAARPAAEPPAAGLAVAFRVYQYGPYRPEVVAPRQTLGYDLGERHTTFQDQEAVLTAIAASASDRVRAFDYGRSVEGRRLRVYAISSPENIRQLERHREDNLRLADPRKTPDADAEALVKTAPAIVWINHCIHGDETASFESAMWLAYTLAASEAPEVTEALRNVVVVLNPVFNPDGHERFVVYYNSVAMGSPEGIAYEHNVPWAVRGRFNHYRFDMNRDKLAQSQPEMRQETREYLRWFPHVFVDQHGQPDTYFFPPNSLPSNRNVDRERIARWTGIFGRANGAAFDRYGWPYVTRETFDLFYPGYLDSFTSLLGAVGMTYETDGGGNLARRRFDNTISTLRDAAEHHFVTALATIRTAAANREALLRDFWNNRKSALTPDPKDTFRRVVLSPGDDPGRLAELAALLLRVGVEVRETTAPFTSARAHPYMPEKPVKPGERPPIQKRTFPAGSLVVDLAQPQGRLARAFLEPDADLEPEFVKAQEEKRRRNERRGANERGENYEFYDTTAWSLPLLYNVEAHWTEDAPAVPSTLLTLETPVPERPWETSVRLAASGPAGIRGDRASAVAYLFDNRRDAALVLALRLLQRDYRLAVATKPVPAGGKDWPAGTLIARVARNPVTLAEDLDELARSLGVPVDAVPSAYADAGPGIGSDAVQDLRRPRVAVAMDDNVSITGYGSVWHLLERAGVAFTPVRIGRLRGRNLDRFNVLVLPDGGGYLNAFGKEGREDLRAWLERGNALLGLAGGGAWFTDKEAGLTTARPVGQNDDAVEDEGEGSEAEAAAADPEPRGIPLALPGAIFRADIDTDHFLGWGHPSGGLPVFLSGGTFLKRSRTGANVVAFGKGPSRLSGFVWEDNTERLLAGTAYVVDEPIGSGHALLYLDDPTFRGLWSGGRRLFLSGILFGPRRAPYFNPGE